MARSQAILRLHKRLVSQRDALRRKLAGDLGLTEVDAGFGDIGDVANSDVEKELNSQLAAFESRELERIEKAIEAIQEGRYGVCEYCSKHIPVERLRALPYTDCCVACQRNQELRTSGDREAADWESAWEFQAREQDRELTIRDIQFEAD